MIRPFALALLLSTGPIVAVAQSIAHYPLDGSADDISGHGNHGTVNGATSTTDRDGIPDRAYEFDGVDNHIFVPTHESLSPTEGIVIEA